MRLSAPFRLRSCRTLMASAAWLGAMWLGIASPGTAWPGTASVAGAAEEEVEEETFVVIKAGRVIPLCGPELPRGEIVLVNGKIRLVGNDLDYPKTARVIDARGEVVMPGMILPRTRWQLANYSRSGVHGDRSVEQELYLDQIDFEPMLAAGFTGACFYPAGTGIPGVAAVYRTAGQQQHRELGKAYVRITMTSPGRDKKVLRGAIDKAKKEIEKVEKARKEWEEKQKKAKEEEAKKEEAKKESDEKEKQDSEKNTGPGADPGAEQDPPEKKEQDDKNKAEPKQPEKFTPPKIDPAVQPLVDWIRDKKGPALLFELTQASDLVHLDDVLKQASELPATGFYLSASYSSDYDRVVEDLGRRKAVVLLSPRIGRLPYTVVRYNLPGELAAAGCTVVLLPLADGDSQYQDLRTQLADLVRAGLSRDDALKAVTLHAARVLGIDDRLGTVEKGKQADLVFLDGDPLAPATEVTRVMSVGEIVWEASKQP
ncbi:MAG: amidohydrolase family protein [Pirellulales bacterium]|nr:amidohydrolase family protein [Pirellulales bacterium]